MIKETKRCNWVCDLEIDILYHDEEWGEPVHDDVKLFEFLTLEAFQAGLSWLTILKKRKDFRIAFDDFKPEVVALYDDNKISELMENDKIIRHQGKILAAINNAKMFIQIQKEYGSFDNFIWKYVEYKPIISNYEKIEDRPSKTLLSDRISKDLKKIGFKFMGSTTVYSFLQATGIVNDHTKECFKYKGVK